VETLCLYYAGRQIIIDGIQLNQRKERLEEEVK